MAAPRSAHPRRIRVGEGLYQRLDQQTGRPIRGKFEYVVRDADHRQHWRTATGQTFAAAQAERVAALEDGAHDALVAELGSSATDIRPSPALESPPRTLSDAAAAWLTRGRGQTGEWARSTRERYDRIVRQHIDASGVPGGPPIGSRPLGELSADLVADWSAANERVLAPTTAVLVLITLRQVCRFAVRRGWFATNPVGLLEVAEKPHWRPGRVAVLEGDDLAKVLGHGGAYRSLFELLAYTGLRIGEALGLVWADVDFDEGLLRVHRQLTRYRVHGRLKTEAGRREVILAPGLVRLLREEWLTSPFKAPDDFIFTASTGRGRDYRHVGEAFRSAVRRSGVRGAGRLSLHSLRHGYASLLISEGLNVMFISRQLGHANPAVTMEVYAHQFAKREHGEVARAALEASHEAMTLAGQGRR